MGAASPAHGQGSPSEAQISDEGRLDPDLLAGLLDQVGDAPGAQLRVDPRLFESRLDLGPAPLLELTPLEDQRGIEERARLLSERGISVGDVLRDEKCAIGNLAIHSAEDVAERRKWKCGVDGDHVTVAFGQPRAPDSFSGVVEIPSIEMTVKEIAGSTSMMVYRLERTPAGWRLVGREFVGVLE